MFFGSDQSLRSYLDRVMQVSGAHAVALYLPAPAGLLGQSLLVHAGEPSHPPELADEPSARAFCRGLAEANIREPGPVESSLRGGWLIRLPRIEELLDTAPPSRLWNGIDRRRADRSAQEKDAACTGWLGIGFAADTIRDGRIPRTIAGSGRKGVKGEAPREWTELIAIGGVLAWHGQQVSGLLREPVSQLPGRTSLHGVLRVMLASALEDGASVGLLLANPDAFGFVNERFGRETGDRVIREIGARLEGALRQTDYVCRFGGAVFGVALPEASERELLGVARKLREVLCDDSYLDGALRLSVSFGGASDSPLAEDDVQEAMLRLIRRADRALNHASQAGGGRTTLWRPDRDLESEEIGQFDRMSGIFTANPAKDYRNMMLLWDTVHAVAAQGGVERLVDEVLERLASAFDTTRAVLIEQGPDGGEGVLRGVSRGGREERETTLELTRVMATDDRRVLLERAREQRRAVEDAVVDERDGRERLGCAVPLESDDRLLGVLYLEGEPEALRLDSSDRILLQGLSAQLAVALDRSRLAEQERLRLDRERAVLRREVDELRRALGEAKLVHASGAMDAVLDAARRVAPTDATVLVCGESGTGKELVARTIHALSLRRDKPLVVVDCSAIAMSLIDSELFGHERGAYTGAERGSKGRLAQADGGTILLDEIGELPLQVQGKLLRFVQEKQFVPVGGTRPSRVDVRVIAATNRDLAAEVKAGRFREDLYYRLMVVQLTVPPLRERPEDVALLARHFVDKYAVQYEKRPRRLSPKAETRLGAHDWPGNVRELQNRVMQAVILSNREEIGVEDLGGVLSGDPGALRESKPAPVAPSASTPDGPTSGDRAWEALRDMLRRRIDRAREGPAALALPLGRWVADDLVLEAHRQTGRVSTRAARRLGIAKTTFRRRLRKASLEAERGSSPRPDDWAEVLACLSGIVAGENETGEDLTRRVRDTLLEEIVARVGEDARLGAVLMGVSDPTYGRWVEELAS